MWNGGRLDISQVPRMEPACTAPDQCATPVSASMAINENSTGGCTKCLTHARDPFKVDDKIDISIPKKMYMRESSSRTIPHVRGMFFIRLMVRLNVKHYLAEVMVDGVLIALAYYGAYVLRWDADLPPEQLALCVRTLPVVIVLQMLCFLLWGVYRSFWRYVGIDDLLIMAKAVLTGVVLSGLAILAIYGVQGPSRAVLILFAMLLFTFVGGSRVSYRLL